MNNDDLNRLANDLLTAFFDKSDASVLTEIANRYHIPITGKMFKKAIERATLWLEKGDSESFESLSEENKGRMFQMSLRSISEKYGAVLGKDFSIADGGMIIDNGLLDRMISDLPPEALAEFTKLGHIKSVVQDPFKMLEDSLGVPFFTSLEAVVRLRVQTLDDRQTVGYLGSLFGGMQNKHNWISDGWAVRLFRAVVGADRFARLRALSDEESDDDGTSLVFEDLLTALGRTDRFSTPEHGMMIGRDDLLALDKVFKGDKMSCAEFAEHIRRFEEKNRKSDG